jgi:isopropylmalate/homocitrate/citramalate synthase
MTIFVAGCSDHRDPDAIDLETALKNTVSGEYSLIAVSDAEGARFVSFQKSWDHKRQYYFEPADRSSVLEKVAEAVQKAQQQGHKVGTMGGEEILEKE